MWPDLDSSASVSITPSSRYLQRASYLVEAIGQRNDTVFNAQKKHIYVALTKTQVLREDQRFAQFPYTDMASLVIVMNPCALS